MSNRMVATIKIHKYDVINQPWINQMSIESVLCRTVMTEV